MPRLTVVIPTYQREEVLLNSVRGLLKLSQPADEIIVIDQTETHQHATEKKLKVVLGLPETKLMTKYE